MGGFTLNSNDKFSRSLDYFDGELVLELLSLRMLTTRAEQFTKKQKKLLVEDQIISELQNSIEREANDYVEDEHAHDMHTTLIDKYPNLIRKAFFLAIFGVLETRLFEWVNVIGEEAGADKNISEFNCRDKGTKKIKKYLSTCCGLADISVTPVYAELLSIAAVRNIVAHNDGQIDSAQPRQRAIAEKYVASCDELRIYKGLYLEEHFLDRVVNQYELLFEVIKSGMDT